MCTKHHGTMTFSDCFLDDVKQSHRSLSHLYEKSRFLDKAGNKGSVGAWVLSWGIPLWSEWLRCAAICLRGAGEVLLLTAAPLKSDRPPFLVWKERQDSKGSRNSRIQVIMPPSPPVVITFKFWAAHVPRTQVGLGSSARLAVSLPFSPGFQSGACSSLHLPPFPRSPTLLSSAASPPSLAGGLGVAWHNPSGSMPPEWVGKSREAPMASWITKLGIGAPVLGLLTARSRRAGSLGPPSSLSLPGSMNRACHSVLLEAAVTVRPPSLGKVTAESNLPYLVCVHVCDR